MTTKIVPYENNYDEALMILSVSEAQLPYVGEMKSLLENKQDNWKYQVILHDDKPVGIFNIDEGYSEEYNFTPDKALGFRAFLIDHRMQGKGIGSKVLSQLKTYVSQLYPERETLVLTVNCRNTSAYQLYLKYGFVSDNSLYHGGAAGPQHILIMDLNINENSEAI